MKAGKTIATYRRLRNLPLWRMLAADNGPVFIGLLQVHLYDTDRSLTTSALHERIGRDLEELRTQGLDFPQTAQAYVAGWLADGYLVRHFPAGASEEMYELSAATVDAIRFLSSVAQPHSAATESRLALVIDRLVNLEKETDTDKFRRIDRLLADQARIDKEIETIHSGQMRVMPHAQAMERMREIISLADDLTGDFRRVRDEFEQLNRGLRERIMDNDGSRGQVLDSLFAGIDLISESEAGRTFSAFWRLLTDPEQTATLEQAIDSVLSRDFTKQLTVKERRFLLRLTQVLLEQGGQVHEVMQAFARSLKTFVQSREYLEHRRISQLLSEAQRAVLEIKDEVKATEMLNHTLMLTGSRIRSLSQWVLHDPSLQASPAGMAEGEAPTIDLETIGDLVSQSEIDFQTLKANIRAVMEEQFQATIADVLDRFPATQGLGSVVGLIALGSRYGYKVDGTDTVCWIGLDERPRSARIPRIFFLKDRCHELS